MSKTKLPIYPLCGSRITELCKTLGLSQKEFSQEIGVSAQTISRIVSGHVGISDRVINRIITRYPRVSAKWLRGDPDAKMTFGAKIFANEQEALAKRHKLEGLLDSIGFRIDGPYDLYGLDDDSFYDLISPDGTTVAVSHSQLDAMVETVFAMITSYMQNIITYGMSAEELMDCVSGYAVSRLEEVCADIAENVAKNDDERLLIDDLSHYAGVAMHKYDALKYPIYWPDETEDDMKKKNFEESQMRDLQGNKNK